MASMEFSRSDVEHPLSDIREIERWASLAAATAVVAYGFSRRSAPGVALAAAAATPFAYRVVTGRWPFENGDTRTALSGGRGIHVREAVRLERPVSEVYAFWRNLGNLPRVLTHLEQWHAARLTWASNGTPRSSMRWTTR
jgi:uncharacterized membrane protein